MSRIFVAALVLVSFSPIALAITEPIYVPNYNFESGAGTNVQYESGWNNDSTINGGTDTNNILTGWTINSATYRFGGRWNPSESNYLGAGDGVLGDEPALMAGPQVAFLQWGAGAPTKAVAQSIVSYQPLAQIAADTDYTLTVAVGTPLGADMSPVIWARAHLLVNGVSQVYYHAAPPAKGAWTDFTCTLTKEMIAASNLVGGDLTVKLEGNCPAGWEKLHIDFDNVRLTKTYTPQVGDLTIKEFFDCYRDGVKDGADIALPNRQVTITGPGSYSNLAMTDANGEISLTGLAAGDYTITEALKADHLATTANPLVVTVTSGGTATAWVGNVLPADINQDGIVDSQDFTQLKAVYGQSGKVWTDGDIAGGAGYLGDSVVDSQDFTLLKAWYGKGEAPAAAVPEPATLTALALAGAALLKRTRKS